MLTFKPLKTKALIKQSNIRRKERFLKTGEFQSNCGLTEQLSMATLKNPFDDMETENKRSREISAEKKYCIALDYRQQSYSQY